MDHIGLKRLGRYITARRIALGYRHVEDLAGELPLTGRTLGGIERGERKSSAGTYAVLENKLLWRPGSIATVLEGGEPVVVTAEEADDKTDLTDMSDDELLAELCRRLAQRHEPKYPVTFIPSPLAPPQNPAAGRDENGEKRRKLPGG